MIISLKECTQQKSKRQNIVDTISYIAKIGDKVAKADSVDYLNTINCKHGFETYESIDLLLMEIVVQAEVSTRSDNPVEHLVLSWRKNEIPSNKQIDEAIKITLKELSYNNCQAIYATHKDTEHRHCHLFINRVDLLTDKVCSDSFSKDKMNRAMAKIDALQGWKSPKNAIYKFDVQENKIIKLRDTQPDQNISAKAVASEIYSGYKSAERILKDYIDDILLCNSWKEAQEFMAKKGINIEEKGKGFILEMHFENHSIVTIKPSKISRLLAYSELIKKWGDFEKHGFDIIPHPLLSINYENDTLLKNIFYNTNSNVDREHEEDLEVLQMYPLPAPAQTAMRKVIDENRDAKKRKNKDNYNKAVKQNSFLQVKHHANKDLIFNWEEHYQKLPLNFKKAKISFIENATIFDFNSFIIKDTFSELTLITINNENNEFVQVCIHELARFKEEALSNMIHDEGLNNSLFERV